MFLINVGFVFMDTVNRQISESNHGVSKDLWDKRALCEQGAVLIRNRNSSTLFEANAHGRAKSNWTVFMLRK